MIGPNVDIQFMEHMGMLHGSSKEFVSSIDFNTIMSVHFLALGIQILRIWRFQSPTGSYWPWIIRDLWRFIDDFPMECLYLQGISSGISPLFDDTLIQRPWISKAHGHFGPWQPGDRHGE